MKTMLRAFALLLILCLTAVPALAAGEVSFEGTVASDASVRVAAPIGGTVDTVNLIAGQRVTEGDAVLSLAGTKVYAAQSGTVTGVFAAAGDDLDAVATRYGAALYIEPEYGFTVSATTDKAYDSAATRLVHIGETVYLTGSASSKLRGSGVVTAVNGTSYTVEIRKGEFQLSESVRVYREETLASTSRLGTGSVARVNPVAVTATGSVLKMCVKNGEAVRTGDVLFETLDGTWDGLYAAGTDVAVPTSGIVESVSASAGDAVRKGDTLAVIHPDGSLYVSFSVPETDLGSVREGDAVELEFVWKDDETARVPATITWISHMSDASTGETAYEARAAFTPDADTRLGMNVIVYLTQS